MGLIIPKMGMIAQGKAMWDALFTRTQRQVLGLFFGHPERSFYANQVVRLAGVGTGSVQRELARLTGAGLLTVQTVGNQKHYRANPDSPIYPELQRIVIKSFGAVDRLRGALQSLPGRIDWAFLFGDMEPGDREVSMFLLSDELDYAGVVSGLTECENTIGRTVRPWVFTRQDYEALRSEEDARLKAMLAAPRLRLLGEEPASDRHATSVQY